ncbi:hypothetical protein BH09VER1_BH09VER1_21640 [soil metagenome]
MTIVATSGALAQSLEYADVETHDTAFYPHYVYTQAGNPAIGGPYSFAFYTFRFSIVNATGSASFLNGGDYIGFCVNTMFPDPTTGADATYSGTPNLLSYDIGNGDYWTANRVIKFEAIANTLAYYADQLRSLDPDGQSYAELVTGINMAFTEIICDYDGTLGSIDITTGNSKAELDFSGTPITSGVPYDTYNYIRNNLIGTGTGGGLNVYTANAPNDNYQDVVFIPAVPEPRTVMLVALGLGAFLARLRRRGSS